MAGGQRFGDGVIGRKRPHSELDDEDERDQDNVKLEPSDHWPGSEPWSQPAFDVSPREKRPRLPDSAGCLLCSRSFIRLKLDGGVPMPQASKPGVLMGLSPIGCLHDICVPCVTSLSDGLERLPIACPIEDCSGIVTEELGRALGVRGHSTFGRGTQEPSPEPAIVVKQEASSAAETHEVKREVSDGDELFMKLEDDDNVMEKKKVRPLAARASSPVLHITIDTMRPPAERGDGINKMQAVPIVLHYRANSKENLDLPIPTLPKILQSASARESYETHWEA
ncbi:hypothetical protein HK101_001290 [Irineochytrium annulatum]|nr:hypothetical protein HK101_001290 [Irineochytrium annulatum]